MENRNFRSQPAQLCILNSFMVTEILSVETHALALKIVVALQCAEGGGGGVMLERHISAWTLFCRRVTSGTRHNAGDVRDTPAILQMYCI